ncbi:hypothetical protein LCGC14_2266740 [marine sediment metagenome]|uniref:Minor tail T domain-containing protein n=1 Tax=marine sediment metagenome TaxID=412755 RepID=A0A0F9FT80_9ZZZZ
MDAQEFAEWVAYSRLDPFGNERGDLHAAMNLSMLYNINRGKSATKSPADFMPDFDGTAHSPQTLKAKFRANLTARDNSRGNDG